MAEENKCKKEECEKGSPKWMTTFTDMNMLLLTFFILLLSMATMDKQKIRQALGSLSGALGVLHGGTQTEIGKEQIISKLNLQQQENQVQQQAMAGMRNYIESSNLAKMISVVKTDKGISVRIMDTVLFKPGSAVLLPEARPIMEKLAVVIQDAPFDVMVEGHTDDIPIKTAEFPTNWELSTARAVTVLKFMQEQGVKPNKLSAAGYAEFHPLLPNITAENRSKNRRVEINFISPELAESGKNIFEELDQGGN